MKYTLVGFRQDILLEKYTTLNATDIFVLRTMVDMLDRLPRKIEVDGKVYVQMTYKMLLEDLPFITESSSTIKRIVQKFIDNNLIERYVVKKAGNYTYFRVTEELKMLEYIPNESKKEQPKEKEVEEVIMTEEQLMEAIDLRSKEVQDLAKEYGPIDVIEARSYVLDKFNNGNTIKDPMAYFTNVMRKGYYRV